VPRHKAKAALPIIFMSYTNPIHQYGYERFAAAAEKAGVEGLIVPDMIPEEGEELKSKLNDHNIHMIYMVAPTTPKARIKFIAKQTSGFLYAVSITGVTGARASLPVETKKWLAEVRALSSVPVCAGFGISGPEAIRELKPSADGFIVGSALVDCIRKNSAADRPAVIQNFIRRLSEECTHG
jgi:tryptophan synthase alpha chain